MNAVTPARVERPVESSQQQLGEVTAVWRITPDAFLAIGWRNEKPAAQGFVTVQPSAPSRGRFHATSWPSPDAGPHTHRFVAAIQLPPGSNIRPDETLLLSTQGEAGGALARLPAAFLDPAPFGTELARLSIGCALSVTRFLLQTFSPAASSGNGDIRAMLHAFLERASSPDGCVEMLGSIDDGCAMLQGWGAPPGPECDVVLIGAGIEIARSRIAQFARTDLRGTATGQVIILPDTSSRTAAQTEAVILLDRRGLRWRPVLPERRILSGQETIGHLRASLPGLQCDEATRALLHESLRPKFDGRLTLHDGGHPVRMAVDLAVAAPGAGTYLTGWLLDPACVVADVRLRSMDGSSARIDGKWTRIVRADVTDAFRHDAALPPVPAGQHSHGFAIHVPDVAPNAPLYLDVSFRDGACGFVPLTVAAANQAAERARMLASVDLHKPSGLEIIERHLAPFLLRVTGPGVAAGAGPVQRGWVTALVVPLADTALPRALLSQFLRDPLTDAEGMIFVCGEAWTDTAIEALQNLARFYAIPHIIRQIEGAVTPATALEAGFMATGADRLLLLAPGTIGRSRSWRTALYAAFEEAEGKACISPTIIYEDEAIRFGGSDAVDRLEAAPYVRIRHRLAGMPASIIRSADPEPSATISAACCLIPRTALGHLADTTASVTSSFAQEAAISFVLKRNGTQPVWLPSVQVYAADAGEADTHGNTTRVARLVDGWCMRARLAAGG